MRLLLIGVLAAALLVVVAAGAYADSGRDGRRAAAKTSGSAQIADRKRRDARDADDDERERVGRIVSLSPLEVAGLTCAVPRGVSLAGFRVGDRVELTCDLIRRTWTLRKIHLEDDDEVRDDDDDGRGRDDEDRRDGHDDDDDGRGGGHGSGSSGHGGGNSGPGGGRD